MNSRTLAEHVTADLRTLGHKVHLVEGTTPIIIDYINQEQEIMAFCFHSAFEVCERVNGNAVLYRREVEPSEDQAVALVEEAIVDMTEKEARRAAALALLTPRE